VSVTFVAAAAVVLWSLPYPACQLSSKRHLAYHRGMRSPTLISYSCETAQDVPGQPYLQQQPIRNPQTL